MKSTVPYIEQKFEEFNRQMFGGKLPKIPVELSDAKTFLGQCVYKKRRKPFGKTELYDFRLRINTRVDLPERIAGTAMIYTDYSHRNGCHIVHQLSAELKREKH